MWQMQLHKLWCFYSDSSPWPYRLLHCFGSRPLPKENSTPLVLVQTGLLPLCATPFSAVPVSSLLGSTAGGAWSLCFPRW